MTDEDDIEYPTPCWECGRELESAEGSGPLALPKGAIQFRSLANPYSQVFPNAGGFAKFLEFNICDQCLREDTEGITVMRMTMPPLRGEEFDPEVHSKQAQDEGGDPMEALGEILNRISKS